MTATTDRAPSTPATRWPNAERPAEGRSPYIAVLAEAVALGDPDAFCRELLWLHRVLTDHAVPSRILERHLAILAELLDDELSAGAAAAAGEVPSRGRAAQARRAEPGAGS